MLRQTSDELKVIFHLRRIGRHIPSSSSCTAYRNINRDEGRQRERLPLATLDERLRAAAEDADVELPRGTEILLQKLDERINHRRYAKIPSRFHLTQMLVPICSTSLL